jgi:seryl-tRNA synthetase
VPTYRCTVCLREVSARRLEVALQNQLRRITLPAEQLRAVADEEESGLAAATQEERREIAARLEQLRRERTALTRKFARDEISREDYRTVLEELQAESEGLERRQDELEDAAQRAWRGHVELPLPERGAGRPKKQS